VYKNVNSIYWPAYVFETSKACNLGLEVSHRMSTVDYNYNNPEFSLLLPAIGSHTHQSVFWCRKGSYSPSGVPGHERVRRDPTNSSHFIPDLLRFDTI